LNKLILGRYTRQGLWSLFLMCALPLHAWTLVLAFRDLSWLTDRTNAWDAVGVLCYGLLFAFLETVVVFVVASLLGFLTPARWEPKRRIAVLSIVVLVTSLWAMVTQLFFLSNGRVPGAIIAFLVRSGHPARLLYAGILAVVAASFLVPGVLVVRSGRGTGIMTGLIDRLGLLSTFYLVFDVAALVIVVIRNL
jgi:hypothetical protein